MKTIKLLLLLTLGLWSDFKLDVPNTNKVFYDEVSKVFTAPLYRLIKTQKFIDMKGKDLSLDMQESMENFLPLYFNIKTPIHPNNSTYPKGEINRFHIVLNKYMDFLDANGRYEEFYKILEKRLEYASIVMNNAKDMIDMLYASTYYEGLFINRHECNNTEKKPQIKVCKTSQIKELFLKYKVPSAEYYFVVFKRDFEYHNEEFLDKDTKFSDYNAQLNKEMNRLYSLYIEKFKEVSMNGSEKGWDEYELYLDTEFDKYENIIEIIKFSLGKVYVKIQKFFSIKNIDYKYIVEYQARVLMGFTFMTGDTYKRYEKLTNQYNEFIKSCPE